MEIRTFTMQYYPAVYELWKQVGLSLGSSDNPAQIERFAQMNRDFFLIGVQTDFTNTQNENSLQNLLIGVVMGAYDGRRGYVHHLAIDPRFQRHGYASQLLTELMHRFQANQVEKIHLFVEKTNAGVIAFYQKLGWFLRDDLEMMSIIPDSEAYFIYPK